MFTLKTYEIWLPWIRWKTYPPYFPLCLSEIRWFSCDSTISILENELIRFLGNKFLSLFFKSRALRQLLAKYQSNWLDFGRHQETSKNCIIDRWKIKLLSPFHRDDIYHENSIKTSPPFTEIHEKIIKSKPLTKTNMLL